MNKKMIIVSAAALVAAAGCSIPYAEEAIGPDNSCASNNDCPAGSICADVGAGNTCIAESVDLNNLVFEVLPAVGSGDKSASSLVKPISLSTEESSQVIH